MRNNKKGTKNPPKQLHRQNDQEEKQNVSKRQQKKRKNSHEETLNDHKKVQIDHKDAWNDNKGHPQQTQRDTKTTTKLHTCTPSTDTRKRRMHRMTQLRTDSTQTQNSDGVKSENQNNHKDTHTKPQRDYKQTAKLNRLKILKGSKKWTRTDVETFGLCLRRFWLWCRRVLMCLPVHRPLVNTPINTEKPNQHFILHPLSVRNRFSSVRSFYFSCFLVHTRPSQTLF